MRLMAGVAVAAAVAAACGPAALKDEDKAAIRAAVDSFNQYFRTDRDSAVAQEFAENGVMLPPNMGPVEGRAAVLAFFQGFPAIADFTAVATDIDGSGDLAYVRGTYSYTMPAQGRNPAMQDHGKFVEIRRKHANGRWLVTVDIFNSSVPVPTP